MSRRSRFSPEVKERAVRLVFDQEGQHPSEGSAIQSVAMKVGCSPESLRNWIRKPSAIAVGVRV